MSTSSSQRTRTATPHRRLAESIWGAATPLVLAGTLAAVLAVGGCAGGSTPAVSSSVALRPAPGAGAPGSPAAAQRAGAAAGGSHAPFVASPAGGLGAGALEPGVAVSGTGDPAVAPGQVLHGPHGRRWIALTFDADMTHAMQGALRAVGCRGVGMTAPCLMSCERRRRRPPSSSPGCGRPSIPTSFAA